MMSFRSHFNAHLIKLVEVGFDDDDNIYAIQKISSMLYTNIYMSLSPNYINICNLVETLL